MSQALGGGTSAFRRQRQEAYEFKTNLGCMVRETLSQNNNKPKPKEKRTQQICTRCSFTAAQSPVSISKWRSAMVCVYSLMFFRHKKDGGRE